MKALSKQDVKRHEELRGRLLDAESALSVAVADFNAEMRARVGALEDVVRQLNEAREEARTFVEQVRGEMDNYSCERSEKWADSDSGQRFADWSAEWEAIQLDEIELELPEEVAEPDAIAAEFAELPLEVS